MQVFQRAQDILYVYIYMLLKAEICKFKPASISTHRKPLSVKINVVATSTSRHPGGRLEKAQEVGRESVQNYIYLF